MITKLLTPNAYSRPGRLLRSVDGLVIHWTANPLKSAEFNRQYFEMRKNGNLGYGSSHYIVDDIETIRCIPDKEIAYHVGTLVPTKFAIDNLHGREANYYTLGIELCPKNWVGEFTQAVIVQAVELCAKLCKQYSLKPLTAICRHFDISGKDCPLYYVTYPEEFKAFKQEVSQWVS